ncbi:MAG: hypothetical protein ABJH68_06520 [Ilumatobacter sp.]|uniref:hypothetical protein n=1 Tax=Ilumatobacter sp. TaxID=1967498 RepID=UPI003298AAB8
MRVGRLLDTGMEPGHDGISGHALWDVTQTSEGIVFRVGDVTDRSPGGSTRTPRRRRIDRLVIRVAV